MDLAEQLEDIVSTQPYADRPAAYYVAEGRRARARRRFTAAGVVASAVVVVVAGGVSLSDPAGQSGQTSTSVASQGHGPSTMPSPATSTGSVVGDPDQWGMAQSGQAATYSLDGHVELATGWHVTQRISSPWQHGRQFEGGPTIDQSLAFALTNGTDVQWVLLDWVSADGGSAGATFDRDPAGRGFTSLAAWVDVQIALRQTRSTDQLVAFAADGTLEARNGVTIREQEPLEPTGDTEAVVARLQVLDNEWWVYAARTPSGPQYIPVMYPYEGEQDTLGGFAERVEDLVAQGRLG